MNDQTTGADFGAIMESRLRHPGARRGISGYVPRWPRFHRLYNFVFGLLLFTAVLPLFSAIALALVATQGPNIFYRGERMGRDGRIFKIYKFRTLDNLRARELTQRMVLPTDSGIETPLGRFLRDTRLDELPQLINVIVGDMNLVGPRPVRAELAEIYRTEIPHYDVRFRVKPGLLGHTQALMSHGTSKRVRARYNFVVCRAPVSYVKEVGLIALVGFCVLSRTLSRATSAVRWRLTGDRERSPDVEVTLVSQSQQHWAVPRADSERLLVASPGMTVPEAGSETHLAIMLPDGQLRRAQVRLEGPIRQAQAVPGGVIYRYTPASDFADHVISRYLCQKVVAPHKSLLLVARARRRLRRPLTSLSTVQSASALPEVGSVNPVIAGSWSAQPPPT